MPSPNELLSVAEVATMKNVPEDTVRRRIQRGRLEAIKKSDIWLIKRKDAEAWVVRRAPGEGRKGGLTLSPAALEHGAAGDGGGEGASNKYADGKRLRRKTTLFSKAPTGARAGL